MQKRILPIVVFFISIAVGVYIFTNEGSGNVEPGLGQMGARFDMDMEEFTNEMNNFYQETFFLMEDWEIGEQTEMAETDEIFNNYFYALDEEIVLHAIVETSTGKIEAVNLMAPFDDGSQEQMQGCYAVMCGIVSVLADVDMDEATSIADSSKPIEYNNILFKIASSNTEPVFMVIPAIDEVLATMDVIEID